MAQAQTVEPQPTETVPVAQDVQAPSPLARAEGEAAGDFLKRVMDVSPLEISRATEGLLKATPGDLGALVTIAIAEGTPRTLAAELMKGLTLAADAEPVVIAQQASAFALAEPGNVASIISVARETNSIPLSEVFGEGLALAANTLRAAGGDITLAAAIQTQATSRDAPLALSEAFLDNTLLTAAGAAGAAGAGAGGGGDITGSATSPFSGGGENNTSEPVTQTAGVGAPTSRTRTITSTATTGTTAETSPVLQ
ncbi:hypothetical protein [Agrobacterium sp. NPDC090273]|uniref:hypothetical protein n=1 Tax=Agrobacterium sp. NPDC090273 TaxID=3363919 RepID=UPI00383A0935